VKRRNDQCFLQVSLIDEPPGRRQVIDPESFSDEEPVLNSFRCSAGVVLTNLRIIVMQKVLIVSF